jgi:lysophospholipase L1-like esterase
MKIMAFGDSITAGYTVTGVEDGTCHFGIGALCDSMGGYPGRLNDLIPGAIVYNEGRSSEDTRQARLRYPAAYSSVENLDYIIILEGVNDLWMTNTSTRWQPFQTRDNLLTMVADAEAVGAIPILGNLLDSDSIFPRGPVYFSRQAWVDDVNALIDPFIDIDFNMLGFSVISSDGTHPHGPGYQVMAGMVLSAMVEAGQENRPTDQDQDNIYDFAESSYGTSPIDNDTDNDGLLDGDEIFIFGTSPLLADSNGNGTSDFDEVNGNSATPNSTTTTSTSTTTTSTSTTTTTVPSSSSGRVDYRYAVAQESFVTANTGVVWEADPCVASQYPLSEPIWKFPQTTSGVTILDLRRLYQSVTEQPIYNCGFGVAEPGSYLVKLHFAEMVSGVEVGDNIFDIYVDNELRESGLDLLAIGYPLGTAFTIDYAIETFDDEIDLRLEAAVGNVRLAGVEITLVSGSSGDTTTTTTTTSTSTTTTTTSTSTTIPSSTVGVGNVDYRYAVAQESFITPDTGVVWEADPCVASQYPLSEPIWKFPLSISGATVLDLRRLYQSVTEQPFYDCGFGVAEPGNYQVTLHFAEMESGVEVGDNVFDIYIENELQESSLDLLALGYPLETAFTIDYFVESLDDQIDISLEALTGNARLAGVEITFISEL